MQWYPVTDILDSMDASARTDRRHDTVSTDGTGIVWLNRLCTAAAIRSLVNVSVIEPPQGEQASQLSAVCTRETSWSSPLTTPINNVSCVVALSPLIAPGRSVVIHICRRMN